METDIRFFILVVLYKVPLLRSETIRSLMGAAESLRGCTLLVWDNSPMPHASEADLADLRHSIADVQYVSTPENCPLSVIYNRTIRTKLPSDPGTFLVLFDHDSEFPGSLFERAREAIRANPDIALFLPVVTYRDRIVSPADFYFFTGMLWGARRLGRISSRFKTAINSGMVVSAPFLKTDFPGYDERFAFYGTDNWFMLEYARLRPVFCVFDAEISHRLDFHEAQDVESKLRRFREMNRATVLLARGNLLLEAISRAYVRVRSLSLAIVHRDRRFLA